MKARPTRKKGFVYLLCLIIYATICLLAKSRSNTFILKWVLNNGSRKVENSKELKHWSRHVRSFHWQAGKSLGGKGHSASLILLLFFSTISDTHTKVWLLFNRDTASLRRETIQKYHLNHDKIDLSSHQYIREQWDNIIVVLFLSYTFKWLSIFYPDICLYIEAFTFLEV